MKRALVSNDLYANSPIAQHRNDGLKPNFTHRTFFNAGSSIYHLDDDTYGHTDVNSLMTHAVGMAEAIHDPGPITKGIMDDIGWRNIYIRFDQVKDIEELKPLVFSGWFESDYGCKRRNARKLFIH